MQNSILQTSAFILFMLSYRISSYLFRLMLFYCVQVPFVLSYFISAFVCNTKPFLFNHLVNFFAPFLDRCTPMCFNSWTSLPLAIEVHEDIKHNTNMYKKTNNIFIGTKWVSLKNGNKKLWYLNTIIIRLLPHQ